MAEQSNGTGQEKMGGEANDCDSEEAGKGGHKPRDSVPMPGAVTAPDGGWGWVVLVATIMVLALTLAFPSCMGIFYTDLQNEFQATNSETSWVPSIMTSVLHAGGTICVCYTKQSDETISSLNDNIYPKLKSSSCPDEDIYS